jgi:hypothetical protein
MDKRDLSLSSRAENTREQRASLKPLHFTLQEIKNRFVLDISVVDKNIESADRLIDGGQCAEGETVLRAQIAFSEGIMDFYIHELSKYCLHQMFTGDWNKSLKYGSLKIPMSKVERALLLSPKDDWFFEHVNEEYSSCVFLGCEPMKDQLNLIGVPFTETIKEAFPDMELREARGLINRQFARRNRIVHQNDRDHATAEQESVSPAFVREYVDNIKKLVSAMHIVALKNDQAVDH